MASCLPTFVLVTLISIPTVAVSQRDGIVPITGSPAPDFASLKQFRGLTMAACEVAAYRVRAATLPSHTYPKPVVIVWTKDGIVMEQRTGGASTTRRVSIGQIDLYPAGTTHSLHAAKGALHFTLIESKQSLRDPKDLPSKPENCENIAELPHGGFACLMRILPNQQITIPKLDVNSFSITLEAGNVRNTMPHSLHWDAHYREGQVSYMPGYEQHLLRNLERWPLRLVLIVPPPAEY